MKSVSDAGETPPMPENMTPATSPAQEGNLPSEGPAPHRVAFSSASFDERRDAGLDASALAPSSFSREGTPRLAPLTAAAGGPESAGDTGEVTPFWHGPHADESLSRARAETAEISRFISDLAGKHGIAPALIAKAVSRLGTNPETIPAFLETLASKYKTSDEQIEMIVGGKSAMEEIKSGQLVKTRDKAVETLAQKLQASLPIKDADIDAFVTGPAERIARVEALIHKLKAEGLDDGQIGTVLGSLDPKMMMAEALVLRLQSKHGFDDGLANKVRSAVNAAGTDSEALTRELKAKDLNETQIGTVLRSLGQKTMMGEALASWLQSQHGFDDGLANKVRSAVNALNDSAKPFWTKRLAGAFLELKKTSAGASGTPADTSPAGGGDSDMCAKAAALTNARYAPATGMSSLFWRRFIDATTRSTAELSFASEAYRDALGHTAAWGGLALGAGERSVGNQELRVDELTEWQRLARDNVKELREKKKREEDERRKAEDKAVDSGTAEKAETTAPPPASPAYEIRSWKDFPVTDIIEKVIGMGLPLQPEDKMIPRQVELGGDADITDLHEQLTKSLSAFCMIEKIGREDGGGESITVFVKDTKNRWYRVPRTGDAFDHKARSLGQAQNTDPRTGTLKRPASGLPSGARRFNYGDADNKALLNISGRAGKSHGAASDSGDVLQYFLNGHFKSALEQGNDNAQVVVWSLVSSKPLAHGETLRHLGFRVPYHHVDRANLAQLMRDIGCEVVQVDDPIASKQLAKGECDHDVAKVVKITLKDGSRCVLAWRRSEPERAFVVTAKSCGAEPFQDMKAKDGWDGKPSDFWKRMTDAHEPIGNAEVLFVEPFREAPFFPEAGSSSAESLQNEMLQKAYGLGLRPETLRSFGNFARLFSLMHPEARFADYSIDNPLLQAALDRTTENVLIEYSKPDENGRLIPCRYCFVAPGRDGGAHARGLPMTDNVEAFAGLPGELLRKVNSENPDIEVVHVLITGPLHKPDEVPRRTSQYVLEKYELLAHAGLPVNPYDEKEQQKFATFIYRNYGAVDDVTNSMLAAYAAAWNAEQPEYYRVQITHRWYERRPLAVRTDVPGTLVQYYRQDGMLNTLAIFVDKDGIRWFKDDEDRVHLAEELGRLADRQNWYAYDIVDVLQFEHSSLRFWREEHDTPMAPSGSADVNMSSEISSDSEMDLADDTDAEDSPQVSAALNKRKRGADEPEELDEPDEDSRPRKRLHNS